MKGRKPRKPKSPPKPKLTKWEMSAARENARRKAKAPLFFHAGLVPLATPEEREAMFGPAFRERLDREEEERRAAEEARGAVLREQVRALVTPEKFAELEQRLDRYPNAALLYMGVLDDLRHTDTPPPPRRRSLPVVQEALFVEVEGLGDVPTVGADGKAIPLATLAAIHGIDLTQPPRGEPLPCASCGWKPSPEGTPSVLNHNIHPQHCPSMRGILLGLSKGCLDCQKMPSLRSGLPWGPCALHLEEILTCDREGHDEGPGRWHPLQRSCMRCGCEVRRVEAA